MEHLWAAIRVPSDSSLELVSLVSLIYELLRSLERVDVVGDLRHLLHNVARRLAQLIHVEAQAGSQLTDRLTHMVMLSNIDLGDATAERAVLADPRLHGPVHRVVHLVAVHLR